MQRMWLAIAVVGMLLVAALLYWFWPRPIPVASSDDGRPIAEAFLAQIRTGQVDAAWESTTAEFKSDEGREQFRQFVARTPMLREPLEFVQYESTELNGLPRGEFHFRHASSPAKVRVILAREAQQWKAEGVFVD